MQFWKFHGNGNDFIMIDNRDGSFEDKQEQVALLCDRHFGIGADGLISLQKATAADFNMRYYNSDGAEGSMCGNGGRCIVAFAHMLGLINNNATFTAIDGRHLAKLLQAEDNTWQISLKMKDVDNAGIDFSDTGSPHHLEYVDDLQQDDLMLHGKQIRYSKEYQNIGGVNVNFIKAMPGIIQMRTYERGVEAETLSCGTGTTAVALSYALKNNMDSGPLSIESPGGKLIVDFQRTGNSFTNVWLTGAATNVFKGFYHEEH
jgi:diaminopimelate epimerase